MKYTISDAILQLKPGADYIIRGDVYSGIEWLDSVQTKPTETETVSYTHLTLPTNREV